MAGLANHIDTDALIAKVHKHAARANGKGIPAKSGFNSNTPYATRYSSGTEIAKFRIPKEGAGADAVYAMIHDELDLDGVPNLNLASFVGTYVEDKARQLMMENLSKNMSDADEYPAMQNIHTRCINIVADLWGAQKGEKPMGTATTGSSEAIHLGGLAMKRSWEERRDKEGKDKSKPNIIMGSNAQVALEKFANYFSVEGRILNVSKKSNYRLDPELVKQNIDENTIGVFVILGSTYTGHYEPVKEIHDILDEYEKNTGVYIPIHVDAASGGFIAPFTDAGAGAKWNFELPRVHSINTSAHKFGLTLAGCGLIIWRDEKYLPKSLIFTLHYLGGSEESYTLNFSRPGAQIIALYFNLIHLGFNGYKEIMEGCLSNARLLSKSLESTGWFRCVSDIHRKKGVYELDPKNPVYVPEKENSDEYNAGLPVVAFTLSDEFKKEYPDFQQVSISNLMRMKQYIIPNYPLPPSEESTEILRVVVRESMSLDLLDQLITDLVSVMEHIMSLPKQSFELHTWANANNSIEKKHGSQGHDHKNRHKAHNPRHGVHRSVC